ncbi:MAG: hypothetical protein COT74_06035 [Bdellovibrionales bacterium CG10_big_fil_rev_8_21_14_0_10_45_34]|nr:MAG: hypothetical protein COT74_06035 [Bdellovibrionales bacterium CG10_big_fil_rev_8_21_14_0_10_45_34]
MILQITILLMSAITIALGGRLLVKSAAEIATNFGISQMMIGMTVVAFGTSAPELLVSLQAAWQGEPSIAAGNVIGSNIANITLVLGLTALLKPIGITTKLIRWDYWFLVFVTLMIHVSAVAFREITVLVGATLVLLQVGHIVFQIRTAKVQGTSNQISLEENKLREELPSEVSIGSASSRPRGKNMGIELVGGYLYWLAPYLLLITGVTMLGVGAHYLVQAASLLSEMLGISKNVVAVTVVAIGTSLPEIVSSVLAAIHGHPEIALGNILGSNIFNSLMVLGGSAVVSGEAIALDNSYVNYDLPVMLGATFMMGIVMKSSSRVTRAEGAFLLVMYACYTLGLIYFFSSAAGA